MLNYLLCCLSTKQNHKAVEATALEINNASPSAPTLTTAQQTIMNLRAQQTENTSRTIEDMTLENDDAANRLMVTQAQMDFLQSNADNAIQKESNTLNNEIIASEQQRFFQQQMKGKNDHLAQLQEQRGALNEKK